MILTFCLPDSIENLVLRCNVVKIAYNTKKSTFFTLLKCTKYVGNEDNKQLYSDTMFGAYSIFCA